MSTMKMYRICKIYLYVVWFTCNMVSVAYCHGLLLLYRPRDISKECAISHRLRYDISYGMGMSDTITLVLRTLNEIDYECIIEIVAASEYVNLLVVIYYPGNIGSNCANNGDAFTVLKKNRCLRLCDLLEERNVRSSYYVISVRGRLRFRFLSNASVNTDINANFYQVTATTARLTPKTGCINANETICTNNGVDYCFTNFAVCDGIKNCGVSDWFDERKSECGLEVEQLEYAPVIAVLAAALFATVAIGHLLLKCLPSLSPSFFVFNANEDNRLRIDPIFKIEGTRNDDIATTNRASIIPVFSSSSSSTASNNIVTQYKEFPDVKTIAADQLQEVSPRLTMKSMTEKLQKKFRDIARFGRPVSIENKLKNETTE